MMDESTLKYEVIAETTELRVSIFELARGESIPWHYHNHITDTFFCMQGPLQVKTREPDNTYTLSAGESVAVQSGKPHFVQGLDACACKFMLVQGVGPYDRVDLEE